MKSKTKGILAVVSGIVAVLVLPVIFGVVAIYLGNKARKSGYPKLGAAGIILGVFSLILWLVYLFFGSYIIRSVQESRQTEYPLVVQVSESMEHGLYNDLLCGRKYENFTESFDNYWDVCGEWYEKMGISKEEFQSFPLLDGFNKGDIVLIKGVEPNEIKVGDIIIFQGSKPQPVVHRVVRVWQERGEIYYQTKGDHNSDSISGLEDSLNSSKLLGKATSRVPYLGWIKIIFVGTS